MYFFNAATLSLRNSLYCRGFEVYTKSLSCRFFTRENHASASKAQAKKDTVSCASASLSLAESAGREQAAKQAGMRQAQGLAVIEPKLSYTMFVDGSVSGHTKVGAAAIIKGNESQEVARVAVELPPGTTANASDYSSLILGLSAAATLGIHNLVACCDNPLVVKQFDGEWRTNDRALLLLRTRAVELSKALQGSVRVVLVSPDKTVEARALALGKELAPETPAAKPPCQPLNRQDQPAEAHGLRANRQFADEGGEEWQGRRELMLAARVAKMADEVGSKVELLPYHKHIRPTSVYSLYFGGISRGNPGPAGAGAVVFHNCPSKRKAARSKASSKPQDSGAQARKVQREPPVAVLKFKLPEDTTSNVAEYAALIMGLTAARKLGIRQLDVKGDSQLVIKQVTGRHATHAIHLAALKEVTCSIAREMKHQSNVAAASQDAQHAATGEPGVAASCGVGVDTCQKTAKKSRPIVFKLVKRTSNRMIGSLADSAIDGGI